MNSQSSYAPSSTSHQSSSTIDQPPSTTDRESTAKSTGHGPSQASSATVRGDPMRRAIHTDRAPPPLPFFSQAIVCQGMVYCSGSIGMSPMTKQMVDGGVGDRTAQALNNLSAVLEAAGSSLRNVVKCNVFLSDMTNFAAMNRVYDTFFEQPKPCRTCVAVKELPMKTDVEIECIAHLDAVVEEPLHFSPKSSSVVFAHRSANTVSPIIMAPSPTKRVTRSTKTKQFTDLGKSPPKITKRSKKPDAAFRPYRISNAEIQDQSDSHPQRPTQQAKRTTTTRRPAPPSRGRIDFPRGTVTCGGVHIIKNTKPGESTSSAPNPDSPADLPQNGHLESEFSPLIRTEAPPLFFRQKPVEELCHDIQESPDLRFDQRAIEDLLADALPQTPEQITQCYQDLRSFAWKWAQETFQPAASSSSPPLNLMDLATTHPELMEYINATTASPQLSDWETFLQKKRAPVVYAIVGKAIDMHIFGEELFGASPEEKATLRAIDRKYMDRDGFHRQQTRAITLGSLIPQHPALPPNTLPALQTLHGQLITLLSPLLPTPSDPNPLTTPLFALLLSASILALAIRTVLYEIIYFTPAPSPGSAYDADQMAALNAAEIGIAEGVEGVTEMVKKGRMRYVVGCSGWPGCVTYWPVGGGVKEGVGFFGEEKKNMKKKQETGVQTQLIARADTYLALEAVVDTNSHPININIDKQKKKKDTPGRNVGTGAIYGIRRSCRRPK
ncbi:MAG: hypothetical protein LQ339_007672 [Xanthoria mediterranea]|nr:MAG: hypothetical protein LQ339_007672 [Xanthoria mediterranea]